MSGPAYGKLGIPAAVWLCHGGKRTKLRGAKVYVHMKGYAYARVTHLDIEHPSLDIIPDKAGLFLSIHGLPKGIDIKFSPPRPIRIGAKKARLERIEILHPFLTKILGEGATRTWVGGKGGGIYIGWKKAEIIKLEAAAKERFKIAPAK